VGQFKSKVLTKETVEDMLEDIHYIPKEGMLTPGPDKAKGVKGLLIDNSIIFYTLQLDKVKPQKEPTSHLLIYKDTGYLLNEEVNEDWLEIEEEEELEQQLGQYLMRNKGTLLLKLELVKLVTVCPAGVCLLGEYLQQQKRLSQPDRVDQLELAVSMFTKANLLDAATCLVLQLQDQSLGFVDNHVLCSKRVQLIQKKIIHNFIALSQNI